MKRYFYIFIALIAVFVGLTFALKNNQIVDLIYYFGLHWTAPLSMMLLVSFALGVVCGYLVNIVTVRRVRRALVKARKDIRQVEQEVVNLRSLPIKDVV